MALPWVRLDANIATHDKILELLSRRDGAKAFVLYVCALGYAGGHGTDGDVPRHVLPVVHGTEKLAQMLIESRLWEYNGNGHYKIHNWEDRQQLVATEEAFRAGKRRAAVKGNCVRWHGSDCGCWQSQQ